MIANVGGIDRIATIVIGLGLILAALTGSLGRWAWIGIVALATGIVRFCPAYLPFGLKTCAKA